MLAAWRLGAGPVLSFWLAYILTRPLGANIGDFLASPAVTAASAWAPSAPASLFLGTILAVVVYLTVTDKDRTEKPQHRGPRPAGRARPAGCQS